MSAFADLSIQERGDKNFLKTMNKSIRQSKKGIVAALFLCMFVLCTAILPMFLSAAKGKFIVKSGKVYYYYNKNHRATGLKKIHGKYYYFSPRGVLFKKGWKTLNRDKYYFSPKNGAAYTGVKTIRKKRYLFSLSGKRYGSGLISFKGKTYFVKYGIIRKGWKTFKGKLYYFNAKGIMQKNKWIGNRYVGKRGFVIRTRPAADGSEESETPAPPNIEVVHPVPEADRAYIYNETLSLKIFNDINAFRTANGKLPVKRGMKTLLNHSILRASHSLSTYFTTGSVDDLAVHGLGQIGLGSNASPFKLTGQNPDTGNLNAIDIWAKSPVHRSNLLDDYYELAVAVMYAVTTSYSSDGKTAFTDYHVSVIATYGSDGFDDYPMYNFADAWGFYYTKDYVADVILKVPFAKWNTYLTSFVREK